MKWRFDGIFYFLDVLNVSIMREKAFTQNVELWKFKGWGLSFIVFDSKLMFCFEGLYFNSFEQGLGTDRKS